MLAMLSSERRWIEEVFITDESQHPNARNLSYHREINVPLASRLEIKWDPETCTHKDHAVKITSKEVRRRFAGDKSEFQDLEIPCGSFTLAFETDGSQPRWGYRLYVTPKFENFTFEGLARMTQILASGGLDLILSCLDSEDGEIQQMASRALANVMFCPEKSPDRRDVLERGFAKLKTLMNTKEPEDSRLTIQYQGRSGLPTVLATNLKVSAGSFHPSVKSRKVYYECKLKTGGVVLLGWASSNSR
jgi:hypothetical protein